MYGFYYVAHDNRVGRAVQHRPRFPPRDFAAVQCTPASASKPMDRRSIIPRPRSHRATDHSSLTLSCSLCILQGRLHAEAGSGGGWESVRVCLRPNFLLCFDLKLVPFSLVNFCYFQYVAVPGRTSHVVVLVKAGPGGSMRLAKEHNFC